MFDWYDYTDKNKCKVVVLEFADNALLQWESLKIQRTRDDEEAITTWTTIKMGDKEDICT